MADKEQLLQLVYFNAAKLKLTTIYYITYMCLRLKICLTKGFICDASNMINYIVDCVLHCLHSNA